ncbi:uncharacterized protein LOC129730329 [Wyeomyia smithii]|uniref:uncharacterized protein LOC129730329 n=1 Tax=Wyeomyia smithii TaxID=174621 RepID=UPI002467D34B|nr:uncharacterized protein LOC129730329 [Wyeomyia smithii]
MQNQLAIERLIGRENWRTCKFAVKTYLEVEDLWDVVQPTPNADGSFPVVDARKDKIVRGKIILLIDPVNYIYVQEVKTAREVWEKLTNTFEDTGLTRQWALLHKLIMTNLNSCGSMEAYVNRMISTAHQLNRIGFPLNDKWIGMLLLAGLPQEYRPMVMGLENSGIEITGDIIKTKLLQETDLSVVTMGSAFISAKKKTNGFHSNTNNSHCNTNYSFNNANIGHGHAYTNSKGKGPKCRRCEKFVHIARNCQAKEPAKRSGPDRKGMLSAPCCQYEIQTRTTGILIQVLPSILPTTSNCWRTCVKRMVVYTRQTRV